MRIAVTGAGGGLGRAFLASAPEGHEIHPFDRERLDVTDFGAVLETLVPLRPGAIVHLAAMTSVDGCERDPKRAGLVNVLGSFSVAYAAERAGALLLAMSTDYVFDGTKHGPYTEDDPPNPLSVYGATKLEGERVVRAVAPHHLVARTSWVFGAGDDYVSECLGRLAAGEDVGAITDLVGTPTYVGHLGARIVSLLESGLRGVVHVAGPDACSWFDLLSRAKILGDLRGSVRPQRAADLDRPAARPRNSALATGVPLPALPPLDEALREVLTRVGV